MHRSAGILLPISSLPSPYGIGTLGKSAYAFADFLHQAGQRYWQVLPLNPTSYGDSPYQSFSASAGNPYFIDLDFLIEDGLLQPSEVQSRNWGSEPRYVDYGKIYENRFAVLHLAYERGWERDREAVTRFRQENADWLENYALFMALKRHFGMVAWTEWSEDVRLRRPEALAEYREKLREEVDFFVYLQFLFYRQWTALREYLHGLGVQIIGDLPIYVAMDSADVWAEPQFFSLDSHGFPKEVSGVPPDYFCEDGQLWGNPLYDWTAMEQDGFGWWIRRVERARRLYDVIRMDHFRGFDSYWAVPYGEATAKNGHWCKGPGMKLVGVLNNWFTDVSYIAEDLGAPSPSVTELLQASGWPGMRVLEFAFSNGESNSYQPHAYERNCVCYTGTHDNSPLRLWLEEASEEELAHAKEYIGWDKSEDAVWRILQCGMRSVATLFVAQMQDYLELGRYHRMNTPSTAVGNWQWRLLPQEMSVALANRLHRMTKLYDRVVE